MNAKPIKSKEKVSETGQFQLGQLGSMAHKPTAAQLLFGYLSDTKPLMLILHLIYIIMVCIALSTSYVIAFHWTAAVQIYTEAHDIKGFGVSLKNSVETDNKLNSLLHDVLDQTGGIRSYIYRYHNGLAAINNIPFFFQTNTHEVISPGASRLLPYEQRIPASFNIAVNNQFVKNQCAIVTNGDADRDSQNYYYYQSRGAKAFVRCPIYMSNGDLFGFMGVDYAVNPADPRKASAAVSDVAKTISTLFAVTKK